VIVPVDDPGGEPASAFDDETATAGSASLARDQLAAVQLLLSTERRATEHDILIATSAEALADGPKSTAEIVRFAKAAWPGAGLTLIHVDAAMNSAAASGLVEALSRLDGSLTWQLTDAGKLDFEGSRDWADSVLARCERFLQEEATKAFGHVPPAQVHQWMQVLLDALFAGIRSAFTCEDPEIRLVGGRLFVPRGYDLDLMRNIIEDLCTVDDVRAFLEAMARAAIDPSDPFGAELVHFIATGYLLHSFLARRDHQAARTTVGSLRAEHAILDTPALIPLLGCHAEARPVHQAIANALDAGMNVIVHADTVDELKRLLARFETDARDIETDVAAGTDPLILAGLVDEHVLGLWLRKSRDGHLPSWLDFAASVKDVLGTLAAMGVRLGATTEDYTLAEAGLQLQFRDGLKASLTQRHAGRGASQIDHDAHLMLAAYRQCHLAPASTSKAWPGAIIVTSDAVLVDTYRQATGEAESAFPISVTPSQWIGIITSCADPATVECLAQVAADEVARETLLAVATHFPVEASRELSRALSAEPDTSLTDVRVAQMTIDDLLKAQPDILGDPAGAGTRIAGEVLAHRSHRLGAAAREQRRFAEEESQRARESASLAAALADQERKAHEATTGRAGNTEAELRSARVRADRRPKVFLVLGALLVVLLVAAWQTWWWVLLGTVSSMLLLWNRGEEWANNEKQTLRTVAAGFLPELLVIFQFVHWPW
jgi:hypothetical protein